MWALISESSVTSCQPENISLVASSLFISLNILSFPSAAVLKKYKVDTRTWFSVGFRKILLKTCFSRDREKVSFGGSVQVTWDSQTLRLSRCASISAYMGLLQSHTLHFLRPVTTVSDKMAAVRAHKDRWKQIQHPFSLKSLDMMIRLALILEKIG